MLYSKLLPQGLTEEEFQTVRARARYVNGSWYVSQAEIIAAFNCGLSKAVRIRAQALARLGQEQPQGSLGEAGRREWPGRKAVVIER